MGRKVTTLLFACRYEHFCSPASVRSGDHNGLRLKCQSPDAAQLSTTGSSPSFIRFVNASAVACLPVGRQRTLTFREW